MCSWNINGVHNKFKTPDVKKIFQSYDIIIISETHFGVRLRCPEDFICIDRSEPIASKQPRGGVAVHGFMRLNWYQNYATVY